MALHNETVLIRFAETVEFADHGSRSRMVYPFRD
jgi:hypothetical protein